MIELPSEECSYTYDTDQLYPGCSLGNMHSYAYFDRFTNLSGFWCANDNENYIGKLQVEIQSDDVDLNPNETTFGKAYQNTSYSRDGVTIDKIGFLPYDAGYSKSAYQVIQIHNRGDKRKEIDIHLRARYSGIDAYERCNGPVAHATEDRVETTLEGSELLIQNSELPILNNEEPDTKKTRILGSTVEPDAYEFVKPNLSKIKYKVGVEGGESVEFPLIFVASGSGPGDAKRGYEIASNYTSVFEETINNIEETLSSSTVLTPDPLVNRGTVWSKVNALRVQRKYPLGHGFTNDPPGDVVVMRDTSWYNMGNDYLNQKFSEESLGLFADYGMYEDGQLTEFIRATLDPAIADGNIDDSGSTTPSQAENFRSVYDLSLNDGTPLFVRSVYHHYCVTKDEEFLKRYYPLTKQAGDYIVEQMRDGLIYAEAPGTSIYGVVGWRNVFPADHLNGYLTELNAICVYALRCIGALASHLGENESAKQYVSKADTIEDRLNERLVSDETGLYSLMIDQWGERYDNITADLVIPVLYGVSSEEMKAAVLNRIFSSEFWTPFGCRTVGTKQPEYDPEYSKYLRGGIWPNITAWAAYAGRELYPEKVAEALQNIFRIIEVDSPSDYNICPGELPEHLHGDTFVSTGTKASPWTMPQPLWLAIEGLAGINPTIDKIEVDPSLPSDWNWICVKDVPYADADLSYFLWEGTVYANRDVESTSPVEVFDEILSVNTSSDSLHCLALRRDDETVVFITADVDVDGATVTVNEDTQAFEVTLAANQGKVVSTSR